MENIGLQDSLLSRFDLLFVMLDVIDNETDSRISDHVVRMHRYRNPTEKDGEVLSMGSAYADMLSTFATTEETEDEKNSIYEKHNQLLHGSSRARDQILSVQFMKKYIHIAKCIKPKLTEAACDIIANEYSRLRSEDSMDANVARTQPVTARTLETLIRLSTAHAKARLATTVAVRDAEAAIELVQFAYFKKILMKERKRRRRNSASVSADEDTDNEVIRENTAVARRNKRTRLEESEDLIQDSENMDTEYSEPIDEGDLTKRESRSSGKRTSGVVSMESTPSEIQLSQEKLIQMKEKIASAFQTHSDNQMLPMDRLVSILNENNASPYTNEEIAASLQVLTNENAVMVADDFVYLI